MKRERAQIIEEVKEIVERKMKVVEQWGVPVKSVTPMHWKWNDKDIIRLKVSEIGIDARYIGYFSGLPEDANILFSNPNWREELNKLIDGAIEGLIMFLLRVALPNKARLVFAQDGTYFYVTFRLSDGGWIIEISGKETVFSESGDLSRSPLEVFETVSRFFSLVSL